MAYLAEYSRIIYHSQDNRQDKILDSLDRLADMNFNILNHGEQIVRHSDYYSNLSRVISLKGEKAPLPLLGEIVKLGVKEGFY
jgi:hypothetical protein